MHIPLSPPQCRCHQVLPQILHPTFCHRLIFILSHYILEITLQFLFPESKKIERNIALLVRMHQENRSRTNDKNFSDQIMICVWRLLCQAVVVVQGRRLCGKQHWLEGRGSGHRLWRKNALYGTFLSFPSPFRWLHYRPSACSLDFSYLCQLDLLKFLQQHHFPDEMQ